MIRKTKLTLAFVAIVLSGCGSRFNDAEMQEQREFILTQIHDYNGLIDIYRAKLSRNDNDNDRYYLATLYNKVGNYNLSNVYLKPLVERSFSRERSTLYAKNLINLGEDVDADRLMQRLLDSDANNGELWNLKGIALAQQGKYVQSKLAFEKAMNLFYDSETVINNLAMISILQGDYVGARNLLLPMFERGEYKQQTVHNLVYALVKSQDEKTARDIILSQKLVSTDADRLIDTLRRTSPRNQYHLPGLSGQENKSISVGENGMKIQSLPQMVRVGDSKGANKLNLKNHRYQVNDVRKKIISSIYLSRIESGAVINVDSLYPINYFTPPQMDKKVVEIMFFNSTAAPELYLSTSNIVRDNPNITNIELIDSDSGNGVLLKVTSSKNISIINIDRNGHNMSGETLEIKLMFN